jgi:pimeloyl-ACP methyl ester carboxylesterase
MPIIRVNGVEIYHEVRGSGTPVMFIMGATGDAGHFETVADLLADEFTVLCYDRRGNGRSPRPDGWVTTSAEEQADDAAALLDALGLAPAAVFGTSTGGVMALCLLVRHPQAARGAILHEPALFSLYDDPTGVQNTLTALITEGMAAGGPPAALERFWRFVAGDSGWEGLEDSLRQRMLTSIEKYLDVERGAFVYYLPDAETLNAIAVPVQVLASEQSRPFFQQAAHRLAELLNVPLSWTPGTHTSYQDHPRELTQAIRPFLRQVSDLPA